MPEDSPRDYIGDQMGYAVRQLPPTPQLYAIDKFIMSHLPRSIARKIILFRLEKGWVPEKGNPLDFYTESVRTWTQAYLDEYSQLHHANTLLVKTIGEPIKIHSSDFHEGQREIPISWENQVKWAEKINEKITPGIPVITNDMLEANAILVIQNEIFNLRETLKPSYIKRGLPFPWTPIDQPYQIKTPLPTNSK